MGDAVKIEIELKWEKRVLMAGRIEVGRVADHAAECRYREKPWDAYGEPDEWLGEHPTEAAAKSAVLEAAVKALGGKA